MQQLSLLEYLVVLVKEAVLHSILLGNKPGYCAILFTLVQSHHPAGTTVYARSHTGEEELEDNLEWKHEG